jgi:hypothetical protein
MSEEEAPEIELALERVGMVTLQVRKMVNLVMMIMFLMFWLRFVTEEGVEGVRGGGRNAK